MSDLASRGALKTYLNPVYPKSFPDPFVLKFCGEFFAYSTGFAGDGNVFAVIRSRDLVSWSECGGAMKPLDPSPPYYWAPEVFYDNGQFYLYYSVGNETFMELRVAVSDRPDGGFVDSGHRLTHEDFAIDAHVFIDDDGSKYLFYATDFLDHSHIGTGTVVDRMLDWFTLEGKPRPVTRAKYDWQVYDPNRKEKGGVRWHTVEGPAVLKRKGLYYEMFSGGNWQNTTYGVSFAITPHIDVSDEWLQYSDGINVMPIIRTLPETVIGPGHNCVVRGPNNRELYCVYHRWTDNGRVMAIDRMDFAGERIFVVGPSHTPQPAPFEAKLKSLEPNSSCWKTTGGWRVDNGVALSDAEGMARMEISPAPPSFLCEISFSCAGISREHGSFGVELGPHENGFRLIFQPGSNALRLENALTGTAEVRNLPDNFKWNARHLLRIDVDHRRIRVTLDAAAVPAIDALLATPALSFALFAENESLAVHSFALTEGFEELFEDAKTLAENGWRISGDAGYEVEDGELRIGAGELEVAKYGPLAACEFAANFRVAADVTNRGEFGLVLNDGPVELVRLVIDCKTRHVKINGENARSLPGELVLSQYHQLRIIRNGDRALCYFDDMLLGKVVCANRNTTAAVHCTGVPVAIEMIRLTAI